MDCGSPVESAERPAVPHVEEFSCSLADYFERRKERVFMEEHCYVVWPGAAVAEAAEQRDKKDSLSTGWGSGGGGGGWLLFNARYDANN